MPDISMCSQKSCKKREHCYRYRAIPSPYWQSYMGPDPENCEHFWDMREEKKGYYRTRSMEEIETDDVPNR